MFDTLFGMIRLHKNERMDLSLVTSIEPDGCSQPDESDYLYQLKQNCSDLSIFNIAKKELQRIKLEFEIPVTPGFCHIQSELYLAGG